MKIRSIFIPLVLIILLISFSTCQKEETVIIDTPPEDVITSDAPVADLVKRVSLKDGSYDNIIDGSSCTSFKLPITILLNGSMMLIENEGDLYEVEHQLDKYDDDDDEIEIIFPVTIIFPDYSEQSVNNMDEFEDLVDDCQEGGQDEDIECIDFVYPVTVFVYDTEYHVSEVEDLENDKDLHNLFERLEEYELLSFSFPLTVRDYTGNILEINTLAELNYLFVNAQGTCDEDDDNDHNDDDVNVDHERSLLMAGYWRIDKFWGYDHNDLTPFNSFVLKFLNSGIIQLIHYKDLYSMTIEEIHYGEWSVNGDKGVAEIELEFDPGSRLNDLEGELDISECELNDIRLTNLAEDEYKVIELGRYLGGDLIWAGRDILFRRSFGVKSYSTSGTLKTDEFNGFEIEFKKSDDTNGNILIRKDNDLYWGDYTIENYPGAWGLSIWKLTMDFTGPASFTELNKTWNLIYSENGVTEFIVYNEEDDENFVISEYLVFEWMSGSN